MVAPVSKYGKLERERRFLLRSFPPGVEPQCVRRIVDRYIVGTSLRLREMRDESGEAVYKLTQKIPMPGGGAQQGWITTIYLSANELAVFAQLPANLLRKTRHSVPPFGIDVFEDRLRGLVMAEAEFQSAEEAEALVLPHFVIREVTGDERFTGGRLAEHGIDRDYTTALLNEM
jgi:CYTH domain-containing protein